MLTFLFLVIVIGGFSSFVLSHAVTRSINHFQSTIQKKQKQSTPTESLTTSSPLAIAAMRQKAYPGSQITFVQTLSSGANFNRYLVSYLSDGLTIYGLMTVPTGQKPEGGWPVILFNHGYIPPASYSTDASYSIMVDPLAAAGYIVFKPDYRGNGNSQGTPTQPYITPDDVTDSMNALASIEKYKDANAQKIGVFGHSMGGNITLHELVITHVFKAAELMAGVVGNETSILQWWDHRIAVHSIVGNDLDTSYVVTQMVKDHGTPSSNPAYWNAIDPTQFLSYISAPVQIQVGSADEDVPITFSTSLYSSLQGAGKSAMFHEYSGADHNLAPDTAAAMEATITFFNQYLK